MTRSAAALALVLNIATQAQARIQEVASYSDPVATSALRAADARSTWVIFDIDNTLIHPLTMMGSHQWGDYMRDQRLARGDSKSGAHEFQHRAFSQVQSIIPTEITEPIARRTVANLQRQGFATFALTARDLDIIDVTIQQVERTGIVFTTSFPALKAPDESVRKGVVFSGSTPKGVLLKRLIAASHSKPNKIIFFDDRRYNLESVEAELASESIEFVGLRYAHQDSEMKAFRPDIANVQWLHFKNHGKLLSNEGTLDLLFK